MAVADFNRDGIPDIAFEVPNAQTVFPASVLLGRGDGTFQAGPTLPAGAPFVADFNGDGTADILIGPPGPVQILIGNGNGTFQAPVAVPACTNFKLAADINNDGKADLVCGTAVLLGQKNGNFGTPVPLPIAQTDSVLVATDFNRDGDADLLLLQSEAALSIVLGRGDGSFGIETVVIPARWSVQFVIVGDFTGDGKPDLAADCASVDVVCVAPGNGDGTFGTMILSQWHGVPTAAADFNADGNMDLVGGDGTLLAGNGDGTFRIPLFIQKGTIAIADFNGDGKPDIASGLVETQQNSAVIAVLLNDSPGDGFYTTGVSSASWMLGVDTGAIASAFGVKLAPQTESAQLSNGAFPTTLGGIRVHLRDSTGDSLAPLIYVSQTQINYLMTSSDAFAWVGIETVGQPYVPKGIGLPNGGGLQVGLYTLGGSLAAATAVRVDPGGPQTAVPVISCANATCAGIPIDVTGNPVYLSLYGTGFDRVPVQMRCLSGSTDLPVTYAGVEKEIPGLDQINIRLPAILAGAGVIPIVCNNYRAGGGIGPVPFAGPPSNTVAIAIK